MVQRSDSGWCEYWQRFVNVNKARENVRQVLAAASNPAVLSSFGKDSLLLLSLVREIRDDVPVLWFRTACNSEQIAFARSVIKAWGLSVYSYEPADVYLLANNGDRSVVQEYSFGGDRLPVAVDLSEGETCLLTAFTARTERLNLPFDLLLVGYKDSDSHWLKGGTQLFDDNYKLGGMRVTTPIRHLSDEIVRSAVTQLPGISYLELDDRVSMCSACMTHQDDSVWCPKEKRYIPRIEWDAEESVTAFRRRFNLDG